MDASTVFIIVAALTLLGLIAVILLRGRGGLGERLSPTAAVAFVFVIAGIVFGDNRVLGYSLMGIGVVIAIVDIVYRRRGH